MRPASSGGHRHGRAGDGNPLRRRPRPLARRLGASGGAIDHTVQDTLKLKLGYEFTPELSQRDARRLDQRHAQFEPLVPARRERRDAVVGPRHRRRQHLQHPAQRLRAVEPRRDAPPRRHHAEDEVRDGLERPDRSLELPHRQRHRAPKPTCPGRRGTAAALAAGRGATAPGGTPSRCRRRTGRAKATSPTAAMH